MGGSATVLGLAQMIMALKMPLRLRVLIPAVENSVDGNAFRPQDILTSRKGLTVEINNTDAEGRLVLADALTLSDEDEPELVISMATLTGAARVAVGPDLSPFYTDDDSHATALADAAQIVADPVWRMPFHEPYEAMIEPGIADLDNAPKGGFAGSITAALFLRRFVGSPMQRRRAPKVALAWARVRFWRRCPRCSTCDGSPADTRQWTCCSNAFGWPGDGGSLCRRYGNAPDASGDRSVRQS